MNRGDSPLIACQDVTKSYGRGAAVEIALSSVTCTFSRGEQCVLLGPSGSGKTTLLSLLGCLLTPTSGDLFLDGECLGQATSHRMGALRRTKIGFVFQHAQLLPFLTVSDNLLIVARNARLSALAASERIALLADRLGIHNLLTRMPSELSGGQRQRVAIARALLHRPPIVLADEPTAALDWHNGENAVRLLIDQAREDASLLIVVTHDTRLVPLFDRTLLMDAGRLCVP